MSQSLKKVNVLGKACIRGQCKDPEVEIEPSYVRKGRDANVVGGEREKEVGQEVRGTKVGGGGLATGKE